MDVDHAHGEDDDEDGMDVGAADDDTPDLSTPGSSTSGSAVSSPRSSSLDPSEVSESSPSPPPPPPPQRGARVKPMTRRERKKAGLPKPRVVGLGVTTRSATTAGSGKIVIPGGRHSGAKRRGGGARVAGDDEDGEEAEGEGEEWRRNGTGRVDVRGFRELKI